MKIKLLILAGFATLVVVIAFLSFSGILTSFSVIQTISTDKSAYHAGETIEISWKDVSIDWTTCVDNQPTKIFRQNDSGWEDINFYAPPFYFSIACIDGTLFERSMARGMHCDVNVISCQTPYLNSRSGNFSWGSTILQPAGLVSSCNSSYEPSRIVNGSFHNFNRVPATTGKYKVEFGGAQAFFEIK